MRKGSQATVLTKHQNVVGRKICPTKSSRLDTDQVLGTHWLQLRWGAAAGLTGTGRSKSALSRTFAFIHAASPEKVPYCFKHFVQTEPSDSCVGAYVPMFSLMLLQQCNKLHHTQTGPGAPPSHIRSETQSEIRARSC
ncbi:unnamed protein product [Pleuronectes platessa]|uniref:Uncharacterized protein n=1 Tax=Pleuronectes platessa TaxID=8262 RepID=A0A9N7TIC3_PLEPL|nr:unnamed protein product [Pleuronectes platessa]